MMKHVNKKNPFVVIELEQKDFLDYANLLKTQITINESNESGDKFFWKNVKRLRFKKDTPIKVFYKKKIERRGNIF